MPNCFTLTKIGEDKPMSLNAIDEMICEYMEVPIDEKQYYENWYTMIGFPLAMGLDFDQIKATFQPENEYRELICVIDFLKENFTSDCWAER